MREEKREEKRKEGKNERTKESRNERELKRADLVILGGGMAGRCAALEAAAASPLRILLLDADEEPGRKLLSTGNGRCNLTNREQSASCYRSGKGEAEDNTIPSSFYQEGWDREVISFFRELGVLTHERNGYVYPRTDQAATVLAALRRECDRRGVQELGGHRVRSIRREGDGFLLSGECPEGTFRVLARAVVLATGGMVSRMYHCFGDGFLLAEEAGHSVTAPVPALCALQDEDPFRKIPAGVRTAASVTLYVNGKRKRSASGELQMTAEGISGIPVFQVSRDAARAFADLQNPEVLAVLDFLPELDEKTWEEEMKRRLSGARGANTQNTLGDFCFGLVPEKISAWLIAGRSEVKERKISKLKNPCVLEQLLCDMRKKTVRITSVSGFEKSQVTAGGIPLCEVTQNMESRFWPGVFFAGEILDVDGICGGYNLTWALHSGRLAGKAAAAAAAGRKQHA